MPSTTQAELKQIPRRESSFYTPYLRTRQKAMDKDEWLVENGIIHNGAHFPVCVFTNNARARSKEMALERGKKKWQGSRENNGTHFADDSTWAKAKGKW